MIRSAHRRGFALGSALLLVLLARSGGAGAADDPGDLDSCREDLGRIAVRGEDGEFVVPNTRVADIAARIERALELPPGFLVLLRNDERALNSYTHEKALSRSGDAIYGEIAGIGFPERGMSFSLPFHGEWVRIDSALFLDPAGKAEITRQLRADSVYYARAALPAVLSALAAEVQLVEDAGHSLSGVTLMTGDPLAHGRRTNTFDQADWTARTESGLSVHARSHTYRMCNAGTPPPPPAVSFGDSSAIIFAGRALNRPDHIR